MSRACAGENAWSGFTLAKVAALDEEEFEEVIRFLRERGDEILRLSRALADFPASGDWSISLSAEFYKGRNWADFDMALIAKVWPGGVKLLREDLHEYEYTLDLDDPYGASSTLTEIAHITADWLAALTPALREFSDGDLREFVFLAGLLGAVGADPSAAVEAARAALGGRLDVAKEVLSSALEMFPEDGDLDALGAAISALAREFAIAPDGEALAAAVGRLLGKYDPKSFVSAVEEMVCAIGECGPDPSARSAMRALEGVLAPIYLQAEGG